MDRSSQWNRPLGLTQLRVVLVSACGIFVLPLILTGGLYLDDNWRALQATGNWASEGRPSLDLLYRLLSFTSGAPNIFPLPLLLSTLAMAGALVSLSRHYFEQPRLSSAFVVMPMWFSPFFLQNLSYQYDGPGMALGVVAMIYAVTYRSTSPYARWLVPALWIALGLSFYQLTLNILLGLYCIDLLCAAQRKWPAGRWLVYLRDRLAQLALGLVIYLAAVFPWLRHSPRRDLLPWNDALPGILHQRLAEVASKLGLLANEGNLWFWLALLGGAACGFVVLGARLLRSRESVWRKAGQLAGYALVVPGLLLTIAGSSLPFETFYPDARILIGLSTCLVALFYLLHMVLQRISRAAPLLLGIPLLYMLSFSFAHGQIMKLQVQDADRLAFRIGNDISAQADLQVLTRFYLYEPHWVDAAAFGTSRTRRLMPALGYVINLHARILPEILQRRGLYAVQSLAENDRFKYQPRPTPVVDNNQYAIYAVQDTGYIMMKPPVKPQVYELY